eukprot:SAG11_NODE_12082_length_722_cov_2.154093_1_plen_76_part_10
MLNADAVQISIRSAMASFGLFHWPSQPLSCSATAWNVDRQLVRRIFAQLLGCICVATQLRHDIGVKCAVSYGAAFK